MIQAVLLILLVLTMYSVASYPNGVVGIANSEYGVDGGPNGVFVLLAMRTVLLTF